MGCCAAKRARQSWPRDGTVEAFSKQAVLRWRGESRAGCCRPRYRLTALLGWIGVAKSVSETSSGRGLAGV